jgi:predicted acetyltransferase
MAGLIPPDVASHRVIERNGGGPAERFDDKLRFWIETGRQTADAR